MKKPLFAPDLPLKVGEEYEVDIFDSKDGKGITRIRKTTVTIPGVKKGDMIRIRITSVKGQEATGETVPRKEDLITEEGMAKEIQDIEYEGEKEGLL